MNDELVKWLRDCGNDSVGCGGCPYNGRFMDGSCISGLLAEAADAIEELQATICNWCAVCPEDKRDLSTCEIYESCRAKPPKEG